MIEFNEVSSLPRMRDKIKYEDLKKSDFYRLDGIDTIFLKTDQGHVNLENGTTWSKIDAEISYRGRTVLLVEIEINWCFK